MVRGSNVFGGYRSKLKLTLEGYRVALRGARVESVKSGTDSSEI